ncbi:MAG TPA: SCO family protein [Planctomycetes bacterium]|nr:SCO family protein [Planctomycetota bacterium]
MKLMQKRSLLAKRQLLPTGLCISQLCAGLVSCFHLPKVAFLLAIFSSGFVFAQAPSVPPGELNKQEHDPVLKSIEGITITDRLGNTVPLDQEVRLANGQRVPLGEVFKSGLPVIFNPIYFSCPMLCNLVVENMIKSMAECGLTLGVDYKVVTMSIDPRDSALDARNRKRALVDVFKEEAELTGASTDQSADGWNFLTGEESHLRLIADSVGFDYQWNDYNQEYAHGAGAFILSPEGKLTRTLQGIEFDPQTLRLALVEASSGKVGTWADQIILTCFVYDPSKARYGPAALFVMRLGGLVTVLGLGGFLLVLKRTGRF